MMQEVASSSSSGSFDAAACLKQVDRLRARGDLSELAHYLDVIGEWKNHDGLEGDLYRHTEGAFYELFLEKAARVQALIDEGQWESVECTRLHGQITQCDERFANYTKETYAKALKGEDLLEDDEEELFREYLEKSEGAKGASDGYASDDSDDEFADDEFDDDFEESVPDPISRVSPSDLSGSVAVRKRKARKHNKKAKEVGEKRSGLAKQKASRKIPITFRYQKKVEPPPNEIIQRVQGVRKDAGEVEFGREQELMDMAAIHYKPGEWTDAVEKDFQAAKKLFARGDAKGLLALKTQFCLAQYRGITYKTSAFDSRSRQISRNEDERGRAIYSMAVFHEAGVTPTDYFEGRVEAEDLETLEAEAEKLKAILLAKRKTGPVQVSGFRFDTQADALQHIYTNEYDYFHSSVGRYLAHAEMWREDQETNLAKVREGAWTSERFAQRASPVATASDFRREAADVEGFAATEEDYERYLTARSLGYDEPTFAKKARTGKVIGYRETEYARYKGAKRGVLDYASYQRKVQEYGGHEPTFPGYQEYVAKKEAENEQIVRGVQDEEVQEYLQKRYGFIPPDDWQCFEGLLNGYCPFVSTGDNPRHALKYAYGMKFYMGHYHERLKPTWGANGKAKRPYMGKVYVSMHSLEEYIEDAPNHVPSLNLRGRIIIGDMIADEREATFPAYVPGERTAIEHIAKVPSFPGDTPEDGYRRVHLLKYGLDEEAFTELHGDLRKAIAADEEAKKKPKPPAKKVASKAKSEPAEDEVARGEAKPETAVDWFLQKICAWLVNYQEVRLIEVARRLAAERGMYLVCRNSLGDLDRVLTSTKVHDGVRLPSSLGLGSQNPMELRDQRRYEQPKDPSNKKAIIAKERASWKKPRQTLRATLAGEYDIHPTPPDGNCLFHALAGVLSSAGQRGLGHAALRADIVYAMGTGPYAELCLAQAIDGAYRAEMAQVATHPGQISRWGSDAEIMAFCHRFYARVRVYSPTYPGEHFADFDPPAHMAPVFTGYVLHVHGNHWEYMTRR